MASSEKNLSSFSGSNVGDVSKKKFGIVVSEWNEEVTEALFEGAYGVLVKHGVNRDNIIRKNVPGSFELSLASQWLAQQADIDVVISLGCVIQGETKHFDFICQAVANGITEVGLKYNKPVIFGVLTTNNKKQALERAGGKHGNKGDEAAITAIKMLGF
ncbi:MAG: 6,7-dimethyl-8-ribityllumazine synthase [Imperialibacter sp.]|uniref:6,7-dimethyl-8-ribityllumazine synthase n=1 Tax=Imperialibacter sp. TaxID=2038411 RepID=UPI0032EDE4E2